MLPVIKRNVFISLLSLLVFCFFAACDETESAFSLSGTILYDDAGLQGAAVSLSRDGSVVVTVETDEEGAYVAQNVSEGSYRVTPLMAGYAFSPEYLEVSISGSSS